jgi:hypothetical protein
MGDVFLGHLWKWPIEIGSVMSELETNIGIVIKRAVTRGLLVRRSQ